MVPEVGPVLSRNLVAYAGSATEVFACPRSRLEKVPGIGPDTASRILEFRDFRRAARQLEYLERTNARVIPFQHPDYPLRLKRNHDAPLLLYYRGNTNLNSPRMISVVGTRQCTEESRAFTVQFVSGLRSLECVVVSGLAFGIDTEAHRTAVRNGIPTIGVVAHGLDTLYPSHNKKLLGEMLLNGGMLTEYPTETRPDRENFPARNRIVAGLCDATVVVETPFKGGAMITAYLAHSYQREVFAVPGLPGDPKKEGNHFLIKKNKAALIESVEDLVEYLNWEPGKQITQLQLNLELSAAETAIMNALSEKTRWHIDELKRHERISSSDITLNLLELELKGLIRSLPGSMYMRIG